MTESNARDVCLSTWCGLVDTQTIFLPFREPQTVEKACQSDYYWSNLSLQVLRKFNDQAFEQGLAH